ncbi:MAG: hypothetical protein M3Y54_15270 [Bacteroidota bacterium]|nr:hypothetical protein [Bacteroidota bacterium]
MGPFVALHRGLTVGLTATALLLAGCGERCVSRQRTIALPAPYNQFFGQLAPCGYTTTAPFAARSSTGLTDSFTGSCLSTTPSYGSSNTGCETLLIECRSTYDYASLYGFSFSVEVSLDDAGSLLRLVDLSTNSGTPTTELTYHFQSRQATVTSRDASYTTVVFPQPPVVTELTNYASGGRSYAQVWRITNPQKAVQGRATAVAVLYVDRDYGLIGFEQRDGTSWTLLP